MKGHALSVALNSAIDNYVKNLKRAFPAEPWPSVKHYAERAWFAADEAEVHWEQVESRLKVPGRVCANPTRLASSWL